MKTRSTAIALALLIASLAAPVARAEEIPLTTFYKELASKNHYPLAEGLTSAQADVKCNIADQVIAAFPDAAGKPISAKYYWMRPGPEAPPKMKFDITGIPEGMTDLANRLNTVFQRATEFVIAAPVYWTFEQTAAKAVSENGKITVTGTPKAAESPIKGLTADVDAATYQVNSMMLDVGQAKIQFQMKNKDLGGKWGMETYTVTLPQYSQIWTFEYTQVDGFWLPSKMSLDLKGPDGTAIEPTSVYEFSNWQANKGVPEGVL
jgi:hypothetical protein